MEGAVGVALDEEVPAKLGIVAVAVQQVPGDHQDGVADCAGGLLLADASGQPPELGGQVGVAAVGGGPGALGQHVGQPAVALGGLAGAAFAAGDVVAGAASRPGGEVAGGGEHAHVDPESATRGRTLRVSLRNGGPTMSDV